MTLPCLKPDFFFPFIIIDILWENFRALMIPCARGPKISIINPEGDFDKGNRARLSGLRAMASRVVKPLPRYLQDLSLMAGWNQCRKAAGRKGRDPATCRLSFSSMLGVFKNHQGIHGHGL